MNTSPAESPSGRDAFAVMPVVDYEPPTHDVARSTAGCRQPLRHRGAHTPRRPYTPQTGRPPAARAGGVRPAPMRQAAIFADAALRRVLEVIDRRRPATQLRPLLAPSLVDSVVAVRLSAAGRPPGRDSAAVLRRMRLQPAEHRDPGAAAEVFGSYSRGERIHAIACRVERVRAGTGNARTRWQVVALHIG